MTAKITTGKRGRPRAFDVEAGVETALKLFHQRGYDAVGVAELGEAMGIRPPSLYAAFGSKAGLFARALDRYFRGEANIFQRARAEGGDVVTVIERTLAEAARIYPEHDGVAGCLVLDGTRNSADPEACAMTAAARAESAAALRDFIATEYPERAEELAAFITIAMSGMSSAARDGTDGATLAAFAANTARAFRREAGAAG